MGGRDFEEGRGFRRENQIDSRVTIGDVIAMWIVG